MYFNGIAEIDMIHSVALPILIDYFALTTLLLTVPGNSRGFGKTQISAFLHTLYKTVQMDRRTLQPLTMKEYSVSVIVLFRFSLSISYYNHFL